MNTESEERDHLVSAAQIVLATLGVVGFAVVQPLFSVLGENPILFTTAGVDGATLVLFAVALVVVPSVVAVAIPLAVLQVDRRAGWLTHIAVLAVLLLAAAIQWAASLGVGAGALRLLVAVALGATLTVVYLRFDVARSWLRYTSVLPLLAAVVFLFGSPTGDLLSAADASADGLGGAADSPDIVVVLLDQLPTRSLLADDGTIDRVRFPQIAAFADDASWYRRSTTMAPATKFAVPAILTGTDPRSVEPTWSNYPDNLFSLLAPSHHLTVFEAATALCALPECTELGPLATTGGDDGADFGGLVSETWGIWKDRVRPDRDPEILLDDFEEDLSAVPVVDTPQAEAEEEVNPFDIDAVMTQKPTRLLRFADTLTVADAPSLYFLHLVLPHIPLVFNEDGSLYQIEGDYGAFFPFNDQGSWVSALSEQRHLLQAQYTDSLVGDVMQTLRDEGMYDDAMVVLLADHGISLEPDTPPGAMLDVSLGSMAYAPLLIKYPGRSDGQIDDRNVMTIDLLPTIAEVAGAEVDWPVDGESLLQESSRGGEKRTYGISGGLLATDLADPIAFSSDGVAPSAEQRWVGSISEGEPALSALHRVAGIEAHIGTPFEPLAGGTEGSARIGGLAQLRQRAAEDTPLGFVNGILDADLSGPVVVAVNGTIVTGSLQFERGDDPQVFASLLPAGTLGVTNEIRVGVVTAGGLQEVALEPW